MQLVRPSAGESIVAAGWADVQQESPLAKQIAGLTYRSVVRNGYNGSFVLSRSSVFPSHNPVNSMRMVPFRCSAMRYAGQICALVMGWTVMSLACSAAEPVDSSNAPYLTYQREVAPFLAQYCADCHTGNESEAGIAFDRFDSMQRVLDGGRIWLRVLDSLDAHIMPPSDMPQPNPEEVLEVIEWIESDLFAAMSSDRQLSAALVMRRLNRSEYNNTIRDLTGLNLDAADVFPADDIGFGYDNVGSALRVSPDHVEKYFDAAERILQTAISVPDAEPYAPAELIDLKTYPLSPDDPVEFPHHLRPGRYLVDFSLVRAGIAESVIPPRLVIGFGRDQRSVKATRAQDETVVYRFWLTVAPGDEQVSVAVAAQDSAESRVAANSKVTAAESGDQRYGNNHGLHVDSMVVRGPVSVDREVPDVHRRILLTDFGFGDVSRRAAARTIVQRFAQQAFRRTVSEAETERIVAFFQLAHDHGESFERAIQVALTTVLVSPQFLYLVETERPSPSSGLSDFELASRLSYFLWSTMPDESLFRDCRQGTLRPNLHRHVVRMLQDPRSEEFVRNFTGQWLNLRNVESVTPDIDLFPEFDEQLRRAMQRETEEFFGYILRTNRSALELLDSDYTFLNERLARHYEIEGVGGEEFQMVALSDRRRGGLVTHASVLTLTSHHNRTSAVKRGQWIMQQLLGTPPPPPPPDVSPLVEDKDGAANSSLRERLELHRASPECASCHKQMDPLGFALENFDAIGRWRTSDGEFTIDASGELPGGVRFDNAIQLKEVLKSVATRRFSRCLVENMLIYALGRGLGPSDFQTVESIRRRLVDDGYQIQNIVFGIVESDAFQGRTSAGVTAAATHRSSGD